MCDEPKLKSHLRELASFGFEQSLAHRIEKTPRILALARWREVRPTPMSPPRDSAGFLHENRLLGSIP